MLTDSVLQFLYNFLFMFVFKFLFNELFGITLFVHFCTICRILFF